MQTSTPQEHRRLVVSGSKEREETREPRPDEPALGPEPASVLEVLGLHRRSAIAFTHLCIHGASTARTIAEATRLGRGDTYRALEELAKRRLVVASSTRPATYEAIDPDLAFARALEESAARRAELLDAAPAIAASWRQASAARRSDREAFGLILGEPAIEAIATRMIERANGRLLVLDKRPLADARWPPFLRWETLRASIHGATDVRRIEARAESGDASSWFLVADEKDALFVDRAILDARLGRAELRATWTDSRTVLEMAVALHTSLWAKTTRRI